MLALKESCSWMAGVPGAGVVPHITSTLCLTSLLGAPHPAHHGPHHPSVPYITPTSFSTHLGAAFCRGLFGVLKQVWALCHHPDTSGIQIPLGTEAQPYGQSWGSTWDCAGLCCEGG